MSQDHQPEERTGWLTRLATESWQAELVVSGISLALLLNLPGLALATVQYLAYNMPEHLMGFVFWGSIYLIMAANILPLLFSIHLAFRAFWIAVVGLSSVYPNGINTENSAMYSLHYLAQWKRDFPDIKAYCENLDKTCSVILSLAFLICFITLDYAVLLGAVGAVFALAHKFLPVFNPMWLLYIAAIFIITSFTLNTKRFRDTTVAHKWLYPMNKAFGKIMFPLFHKQLANISGVIYTNTTGKKMGIGVVLSTGLLIAFQLVTVVPKLRTIPAKQSQYLHRDDNPHSVRNYHYETSLPTGSMLYSPILPDKTIGDSSQFTFFYPLPRREEAMLEARCPFKEEEELENEYQSLLLRYAHELACINEQVNVFINDQQVPYTPKYYRHPNRGELGCLITISSPPLQKGQNMLMIKHAWKDEHGQRKISRIPFTFAPS